MLQGPVGTSTASLPWEEGPSGAGLPGMYIRMSVAQPLGKRRASAGPVLAAPLERLASLQLIAWEPEQEEEVTVVTARPNFQDSIHVGFVPGLKKFTEYLTSALCFTTPGDGPRSTPQLVRTHEDGRQPRSRLPLPPAPCMPPHGPGRALQAQGSPALILQPGVPLEPRGPSCRRWSLAGSNWPWVGWGAFSGCSARACGTPELQ